MSVDLELERRPVVMVVEDDAGMRKLLRVTLTTAGYAVLEAGDARTALTLASHAMPDLIIQDLLLPDSAGFSLVQELRALPGGDDVPILALSGTQSRLDEAWRLRGGFSAYLHKPVQPSRLEEAVKMYLRPGAGRTQRFGRGQRALVVDDTPGQAKLLAALLADLGFTVWTTDSPQALLAEARRERPEVVVADVLMPEMDGFLLCLEIRSEPELALLPVVLVSAAAPEDSDFEMARRVAASALIMGTPGFWGLQDAIARCLAEDAGPAPAQEISAGALRVELTRRSERLRGADGQGVSGESDRRSAAQSLELRSLARLAGLVVHRRDPHAVLEEALAEGFAALGTCPSAVLLQDGSGGLVLHGQHGGTPALLGGLRALARDPAIFEPMWNQGTPLVVQELFAEPHAAAVLRGMRAPALSLTPLLAAGRRVGVLVVVHLDAPPAEDRLAFVQIVAGLLGQALALVPA